MNEIHMLESDFGLLVCCLMLMDSAKHFGQQQNILV